MKKFASIHSRLVRIVGWPNGGWRGADMDGTSGQVLPFRFEITDDGSEHYLLVYESLDRVYSADTWHQTLEEAIASAKDRFGIERAEWVFHPVS